MQLLYSARLRLLGLFAIAWSAACETGPKGPAAPKTAQTVSALPADGKNSRFEDELAFVPGLGMLDGTDCENWPKDFQLSDPFPGPLLGLPPPEEGEQAPPLSDLLDRWQNAFDVINGPTAQVSDALEALQSPGVTAIGTKFSFELAPVEVVRSPSPPLSVVAALDSSTRTGYVISRAWMCTQAAAAAASRCTTYQVQNPAEDPSAPPYTVLMRSTPESVPLPSRANLVMITAPEISLRTAVRVDVDVLLVSDNIDLKAPLYVIPASDPFAPINQPVSVMRQRILAEPLRPFLGLVGRRLKFTNVVVYNGGGAQRVELTENVAKGTPELVPFMGSTGPDDTFNIHPDDFWEVEMEYDVPTEQSFEDISIIHRWNGDPSIERKDIRNQFKTRVHVRNALPIRRERVQNGRVVIACESGSSCTPERVDTYVNLYESGSIQPVAADFVGQALRTVAEAMSDICVDSSTCDFARFSLKRDCTEYVTTETGTCGDETGGGVQYECPVKEERECIQYDTIEVCFDIDHNFNRCFTLPASNPDNAFTRLSPMMQEKMEGAFENYMRPYDGNLYNAANNPPASFRNTQSTLIDEILLTRGLSFDQRLRAATNESLRTGVLSEEWLDIRHELTSRLPQDPDSSDAIDLVDTARVSELTGLPVGDLELLRLRAARVPIPNDEGVRVNAIGLPYGPVGRGWLFEDGSPGLYLRRLRDTWGTVAADVDRLQSMIRTGQAGNQLLQITQQNRQLAMTIAAASGERQQSLDTQVTSVQGTLQTLEALGDQLNGLEESYRAQVADIWRCEADDMDGCVEAMQDQIGILLEACVEENSSSLFQVIFDIISIAAPSLKLLGGLADGILARAWEVVDDLSRSSDALQTIGTLNLVAETLEKINKAVGYAKAASTLYKKIEKAVKDAKCPEDSDEYVAIQNQLQTIADVTTTLEDMRIQISLLGTLISRFSEDIAYYSSTADTFQRLDQGSARYIERIDALMQTAQGESVENASAVALACPLARMAVDASLIDIYRASQALQVSNGERQASPMFRVLPDPEPPPAATGRNPDLPPPLMTPLEHGFLISLWDINRFQRRIFPAPGQTQVSPPPMIDAITQRFEVFQEEICRSGQNTPVLPNGVFVLTKTIEGAALDRFLGRGNSPDPGRAGRLSFDIDVDDLLRAESPYPGIIDPVRSMLLTGSGQPDEVAPLAAPVVLEVYARAERDPGNGTMLSADRGGPPHVAIIAPSHPLMPVSDQGGGCPDGSWEVISEEALDHGQGPAPVRACLARVNLGGPSVRSATDPQKTPHDLLNDFLQGRAPYCGGPHGDRIVRAIEGRPVLGTWTLAHDQVAAAGITQEASTGRGPVSFVNREQWIQNNGDVKSLEITFVLAAEILSAGASPPLTLAP